MECPNRELLHVDLDSSEMILIPIRLVRESKTVVDSGFHVLDSDSGFQVRDSGFFVTGTWIPDSNPYRKWDFGFQSPGFAFPQAKISPIPESGFCYMGRG